MPPNALPRVSLPKRGDLLNGRQRTINGRQRTIRDDLLLKSDSTRLGYASGASLQWTRGPPLNRDAKGSKTSSKFIQRLKFFESTCVRRKDCRPLKRDSRRCENSLKLIEPSPSRSADSAISNTSARDRSYPRACEIKQAVTRRNRAP